MSLPKRKHPRLKQHDYSEPSAYFITVCTKNKAHILSRIVVDLPPSVGRDALIPPRRSHADCVKPCEFVQILFTICPRIAGRNCVKFIRITKNELSALYSVDKCVPKGYCNSNSSAKCNEQEMTYPYHRLQKAVGCARWQQGAVWPSPASSLGESGQNRPPCSSSREPSVNGVRSPAQCGVGLRVSGRH